MFPTSFPPVGFLAKNPSRPQSPKEIVVSVVIDRVKKCLGSLVLLGLLFFPFMFDSGSMMEGGWWVIMILFLALLLLIGLHLHAYKQKEPVSSGGFNPEPIRRTQALPVNRSTDQSNHPII